jgi:hypothetical protein
MCLLQLAAGGVAVAATGIGGWSVSTRDNGYQRPVTTAILVDSDGDSLIAACDTHGLDLFVSFLDPLPKESTVAVQWRADGGAAHRQAWEEGADRSSLSPGSSAVDAAFLRQIAHARTLTLAVAGRRSTFQLEGVRQVAALVGACEATAVAKPASARPSPAVP